MKTQEQNKELQSMTFYKSFYDSVKGSHQDGHLKDEDITQWFFKLCEYSFNDEEPKFTNPLLKALFMVVKPSLDKSNNLRKRNLINGSATKKSPSIETQERLSDVIPLQEDINILKDYHQENCPKDFKPTKKLNIDFMIENGQITTKQQIQKQYGN